MRYHDFIDTITKCVMVPAQAADAPTAYVAIWRAPYKCRVTGLGYVPIAGVTGQDTESRNLNVDLGSTKAEQANLDLEAGTNLTAKDDNAIPITVAAGYIDLEEGDTLILESELVGTSGLAVGIGDWTITFKGN